MTWQAACARFACARSQRPLGENAAIALQNKCCQRRSNQHDLGQNKQALGYDGAKKDWAEKVLPRPGIRRIVPNQDHETHPQEVPGGQCHRQRRPGCDREVAGGRICTQPSTLNSPPVPDEALEQVAARMQSPNDELPTTNAANSEVRSASGECLPVRHSKFAIRHSLRPPLRIFDGALTVPRGPGVGIAEPKEALRDAEVVKG